MVGLLKRGVILSNDSFSKVKSKLTSDIGPLSFYQAPGFWNWEPFPSYQQCIWPPLVPKGSKIKSGIYIYIHIYTPFSFFNFLQVDLMWGYKSPPSSIPPGHSLAKRWLGGKCRGTWCHADRGIGLVMGVEQLESNRWTPSKARCMKRLVWWHVYGTYVKGSEVIWDGVCIVESQV